MAKQDWYSEEEDELIKATSNKDLDALASKLGRKRQSIMNRRQRLVRGDLPWSIHRNPVIRDPIRVKPDVLLGRPTWFDEDNLRLRLVSRR